MSTRKIGIINVNFENASAGALARQLFFYGKKEKHTVYAFYGRGEKVDIENTYLFEKRFEVLFHKLLTLITGRQGSFSIRATRRLLLELKSREIDTVVLIQVHGYYLNERMLFKYLKDNNIRTIYITADEYACMGKCCYCNGCEQYMEECYKCPQTKEYPKSLFFDTANYIWKLKKSAYSDYNNLVFMGPRTNLDRFRESYLLRNKKLVELDWGIDTDFYKESDYESLYERYGIPRGKIYILTVAPFSLERKGVKKFFLESAKEMDNRYHFINVGFDIERDSVALPDNFTPVPFIKDQIELVKFYSMSDLYVLASMQDTQPLSLLIALSCGTPACCFRISGLRYIGPEDEGIIKYPRDMTVSALVDCIKSTRTKDEKIKEKCREYALMRYSNNTFNRKVYDQITVDEI